MTKQTPIGSGYGDRTSAAEILAGLDLRGKVAIITGGYSGLGLAATQALSAAGAHVVVGGRSPKQAQAALAGLANVEFLALDLGDPRSIRGFAERFLASKRHADIVINSAGIMACPETRIQGWEAQFATNHLGHFALIAQLWPALADGLGCRVVALSSGAHQNSGIRWDDIHFAKGYDRWLAYGQSKTANALFAVQLDRLGKHHGLRAFAVHPGSIITPLQRHLSRQEMLEAGWIDAQGRAIDPSFKSVEQGAATQVWAATAPALAEMGGVYCEDCDIAQLVGESQPGHGVSPHAIDPGQAARLWELSVELTGVGQGI